MTILFWILQVLLALHTVAGSFWKFSNSEQAVPSLKKMPHSLWLGLIGFEWLCAIGLVLPAVVRSLGILAPLAALGIVAEMLLFAAYHFSSGVKKHGQLIYWLVVAVVSVFIACGRFVLAPF